MKKSFKLKFDDEKDREEVSIEEKDAQEEPEKPAEIKREIGDQKKDQSDADPRTETDATHRAEKPQIEVSDPPRVSPPEPEEESVVDKDTVEVSDEDAFRIGKIVIFSVLGLIVLIAIVSSFSKAQKQTTKKEETGSQEPTQTVFEQKKAEETQQLIASAQKYTVEAGETLYGIAIKLDMDWKDIAKLNDIEPPYTLRTGQELLIPDEIELETDKLEEE